MMDKNGTQIKQFQNAIRKLYDDVIDLRKRVKGFAKAVGNVESTSIGFNKRTDEALFLK